MADMVAEKSSQASGNRKFPADIKILLVGSDHKAAMEQYFTRYLTELGVPNDIFPAQGLFYKYYNSSILNKVFFKLGVSSIYKSISDQLLQAVASKKPDVLFVFKGMEILPSTLSALKERGIKLVNYNPDNPFLFSGSGSGNRNVEESIPLFDLHLTYDRSIKAELEKRNLKAILIPFGFDITEEEVKICAADPEVIRVCFLGNPDKDRCKFLNTLAEKKLPVDVYGQGWTRFNLNKEINVNGPVYGLDYWKVLRKYRVQLNLMRPHNPHSHNMRSMEVPGVGGIGLFPDTPDHREFFEEGKEIFLYGDVPDCCLKAQQLLLLTKEKADSIRSAARSRSLHSGYSYKHRTQQFIESLVQIL
jgi:hypothetical protein